MKKILFLLLLFGGFLNAQIVPCISNTMKRYNEKIDSVYVKNDTLYVLDSFSRLTKFSLATPKKDTTYSKLLFVDPINGSDVTGTGSDNNMFKTITKALSVADNSGYRIVLAAGTYNESPTISKLNIDLVTVAGDIRGNTFINGTVTVSNASSSVGLDGLSINNVVNTGAGSLYINNSTINTQLTKSGAGYLEVRNSQLQTSSTSTISNGTALIQDNLISNLTISGASTAVTAKDNIIDVLGALTYSGGFYSVQNNTGNVVTTSATNIETALIGQGVPSATAKNYVTNFSNKLAMLIPDSVATSSNVVVWSNATKRLEITKFPTQIDTTSLSNRINQKVSYTDTASMLLPYLRKVDIASLSNRIDAKIDSVWYKSDTMFVKTKTGTTSYPQQKYVDSIYKNTKGDTIFWKKNGTTYKFAIAPKSFDCGVVYFNGTNPSSATIFDTANPPVNNNNALKNLDCAIYIGTDESTWTSDGTSYSTYIAPNATEWVLSGTSTDAGANKTGAIARSGLVAIGKTSTSGAHNLEVQGNQSIKNNTSGAGAGIGLEFNTNANAPRFSFVSSAYITEYGVDAALDAYFKALRVGTNFRFSTNAGSGSAERFTILSGGNVGVNQPNPISQFANTNAQIQGSTVITGIGGSINWVATGGGFGHGLFNSNTAGHGLLVKTAGTTSSTVIFEASTGTNQNGAPAATPVLNAMGNGNVGIKTATPAFNLDVNGTARIVTTPTITTATKSLVKDPSTGQVSEQEMGGLWQFQTFTATAGQTTFTLSKTPIGSTNGKVHFTRNGVTVTYATTVTGNVVTYVPATNGGKAMNAGDRIEIHYEAF